MRRVSGGEKGSCWWKWRKSTKRQKILAKDFLYIVRVRSRKLKDNVSTSKKGEWVVARRGVVSCAL